MENKHKNDDQCIFDGKCLLRTLEMTFESIAISKFSGGGACPHTPLAARASALGDYLSLMEQLLSERDKLVHFNGR